MIKININRGNSALVCIDIPYNTKPSSFIKKQYREGRSWGIDYDTVPSKIKKDWFAADIFWRLFRALYNGIPVVIGKKVYRCEEKRDKNEIYKNILHISKILDRFKNNYWLDEQNEELVTVIFK